ncbi:MAG TPA: phosphate acetyltransferase [Armatimonadota bacterium]
MSQIIADIRTRAARLGKRIALPEAEDDRTLIAARQATDAGLAQIVLIGSPDEIAGRAELIGLDLSDVTVVDPQDPAVRAKCVALYMEARAAKGATEAEALEQVADPMVVAACLLRAGEVEGSVAGASHSTAETLRPLLRIVGLQKGISVVSSCFIMVTPAVTMGEQGVFVFADAGVVPQPTAEQLADIAITTAQSAALYLDCQPRVAMLSFSTKGSACHPDVDKVVEATRIAQEKAPELLIEGELQADAALVPAISASKAPGNKLGGRANVLVFPDLDAANIGYKLVQRLTGGEAYGPLVQGLAKAGMDLSRGSSADEITNVIAIAALRAEALAKS